MCNNGTIYNSSTGGCECCKLCIIGEYLDYANCKFRKNVTHRIAKKCDEDIDGNKMVYNLTLYHYE